MHKPVRGTPQSGHGAFRKFPIAQQISPAVEEKPTAAAVELKNSSKLGCLLLGKCGVFSVRMQVL